MYAHPFAQVTIRLILAIVIRGLKTLQSDIATWVWFCCNGLRHCQWWIREKAHLPWQADNHAVVRNWGCAVSLGLVSTYPTLYKVNCSIAANGSKIRYAFFDPVLIIRWRIIILLILDRVANVFLWTFFFRFFFDIFMASGFAAPCPVFRAPFHEQNKSCVSCFLSDLSKHVFSLSLSLSLSLNVSPSFSPVLVRFTQDADLCGMLSISCHLKPHKNFLCDRFRRSCNCRCTFIDSIASRFGDSYDKMVVVLTNSFFNAHQKAVESWFQHI